MTLQVMYGNGPVLNLQANIKARKKSVLAKIAIKTECCVADPEVATGIAYKQGFLFFYLWYDDF